MLEANQIHSTIRLTIEVLCKLRLLGQQSGAREEIVSTIFVTTGQTRMKSNKNQQTLKSKYKFNLKITMVAIKAHTNHTN